MTTPNPSTWPAGFAPVTIPPARDDATKSWAKIVHGINPAAATDSKSKGGAIEGLWLERGGVYALPPTALVLTFDRVERRDRFGAVQSATAYVTLYQVTQGDGDGHTLAELKTWTNKKGILGPQIITGLTARLKKATPPRVDVPVADITISEPVRANTRAERCYLCQQEVPAGQGVLERTTGGRSKVRHAGTCPPPPPRRNSFMQPCHRCGQPVPPYMGILTRSGEYAPWRVEHDGPCPQQTTPAAEPPVRRNSRPGVCARCLQTVPAGEGHLSGGPGHWTVTHPGDCPPHPLNPDKSPTWLITSTLHEPGPTYHSVPATPHARRVEVWAFPGRTPVPETAPGYRRDGDRVSFIAVTLAESAGVEYSVDDEEHVHVTRTLVRVATPEEAAPVLDQEATEERRVRLAARVERLLAVTRYPEATDYTQPEPEEIDHQRLSTLPAVPLPAGVGDSPRPYEPRVLLDRENHLVWTRTFNGYDGDTWALNNAGGWIIRCHPLTPEREQLIADLVAELDDPAALARQTGAGITPNRAHEIGGATATAPPTRP